MNVYHHKRIKGISKTGLTYLNELNQEVVIDFDECRSNWVKYVNSSGDFETTILSPDRNTCVGWRDAFDNPMYIEFFNEPRTRFIYPYKRNLYEWIRNLHGMRAYRHYRKTCTELEENGWSTFDLG